LPRVIVPAAMDSQRHAALLVDLGVLRVDTDLSRGAADPYVQCRFELFVFFVIISL
jgi:hypothetical protein